MIRIALPLFLAAFALSSNFGFANADDRDDDRRRVSSDTRSDTSIDGERFRALDDDGAPTNPDNSPPDDDESPNNDNDDAPNEDNDASSDDDDPPGNDDSASGGDDDDADDDEGDGNNGGNTPQAASRALVLYDAPSTAYAKLGRVYAIMLRNLLGHFSLDVDMGAVEDYSAGRVENYDAIFYIGSYFDNPLPAAFLQDVMATERTVVWMRYNIWRLAWDGTYPFSDRFGVAFDGVVGFNSPPSATNPAPGFFDTVSYKNLEFRKYYTFDESTQTPVADPDVGLMRIVSPELAQSVITASDSSSTEPRTTPYVTRARNLWYVADIPFSFIGPRDRYVVFSDILHDMLNSTHAENHRAMVRLEDVGALVNRNAMQQLSDYLYERAIPFSLAVIPFYRDPLGAYNGGQSQEIHLADASTLLQSIAYAADRGGKVVMHGYTHQYDAVENPYSGVSGDDFEFWDSRDNSPVPEDAEASWILDRVDAGLAECAAVGLTPFAWETPHYQGSPRMHQAVAQRFSTRYERSFYYTSLDPQLDLPVDDPNRDFFAGQFFPYVIFQDYYGQRVLPENLGNVEYDIRDIDPLSNLNVPWEDLLTHAEYGRVVRDGFASFFFHPFWLEPDLGTPGLADFKNLVEGITALGYTWVGADTLAAPANPPGP